MKLQDVLTERIYSSDGKLVITIQNHREASDSSQISTYVNRQPYVTHIRGVDAEIYSLFNYVSGPEVTNLLSSLKGKGPYELNPKQLDTFLVQCQIAIERVLEKTKPDVIIYPKSSSTLIGDLVSKITGAHDDIKVLGDAFVKKAIDAESVEPLINTAHPDWEKFSSEHPDEVKKLKKSVAKMIRDHKGRLELKKLYKPYLKFIKNFIEMKDAYEVLDSVLDKSVLVLDDVLSSGTTMAEMVRQLAEMEPKSLAGLTIFKHTTKISS